MNAFDWAVKHRETSLVKLLVRLVLPFLKYSPLSASRLSNALLCERLVQGLPRIGANEAPCRLMSCARWAQHLVEQMGITRVLLGGTSGEQAEFTAGFQPPFLVKMPPSTNTLEQVERTFDYLNHQAEGGIILLAHEGILTRAYLTFVKQAALRNGYFRIYPYGFIEPNRVEICRPYLEFASCYEAIRLGRYQHKGHTATLTEAFAYLEMVSKETFSGPVRTMAVIF